MLKVSIPNNNLIERKYIIHTLLSEFLGLRYSIDIDDNSVDYKIFVNDNVVVIEDQFFSFYPKELSYLCEKAIPEKVTRVQNELLIEADLPVIYGGKKCIINTNKIECDIDIFASSFFMITRWEEYVNGSLDPYNRFDYKESIAYKNDFLHRPVVNEYVEFLWACLLKSGYKGERKNKEIKPVFTHDIDRLFPGTLRIIIGDILKRRQFKLTFQHLGKYLKSGLNPYDTFDFIMDKSDEIGEKSHFYFMSSNSTINYDTKHYLNSKSFARILTRIHKRGHIVGFHPGYSTYNNADRFEEEKNILKNRVAAEIKEGRQHYLRFKNPETFRIWEANGMELDSTLGYALKEGFRCGTGDEFYVFDILERKQLTLKERPLIIMDGTLKKQYSNEKAIEIIRYYISISKKYNSTLTFLFHNDVFYLDSWSGYRELYSEIFEVLKNGH